MKLTSSLKIVKPTPSPFAVACLATLLAAACLVTVWKLNDDSQARTDAYGESLAAGLAQLSVGPLLKQDRIALGVMTNRTLALPEVTGVAVFTIDDQVLAASGNADNGLRYTKPVTFDDGLMGYVRVALRQTVDPASVSLALLGTLAVVLVPLMTVGAFSIRYVREPGAAMVTDDGADPVAEEAQHTHHLVAVNLYHQISMTPDIREVELEHAHDIAQRVVDVYLGKVRRLPGTGLLVQFAPSDDADRALQVLCATFVLAELLAEFDVEGDGIYRLGLHSVALPPAREPDTEDAEIADVALLSALAKHLTVAVSDAFPIASLRDDQVHSQRLNHPLLEELDTVEGAYLVTGLAPVQHALVTRQVARLSDQWGSTASESTF